MNSDVLAYLVIIADLLVAGFLTWRIVAKKSILWGAARFIYLWVVMFSLYHCGIYIYSTFFNHINEMNVVYNFLHPVVLFYMLNPLLIALVHWRGGCLI